MVLNKQPGEAALGPTLEHPHQAVQADSRVNPWLYAVAAVPLYGMARLLQRSVGG